MFIIQLYNFIFGYVTLKINGEKPERFINVLMNLRIKFWDIKKPRSLNNELYVKLPGRYAANAVLLEKIAMKSCTQCEIIRETGIRYLLIKHKYRLGIYVGILLGASIIYASTFFIWEVKITDSNYPNNEEIVQILERYGCKNGAYIPKLDVIDIQNKTIIANKKISWIAINIKGTIANVEIRLRDEPVKIIDKDTPVNIVASKAGKVVSIDTYEGQKIASIGNTVKEGDLLISGAVNSNAVGMRIKHAMGKVMAETIRIIEVKIPLKKAQKEYTGTVINKNSLNIFGKNVNLYLNSGNSIDKYDKIEKTEDLKLFNAVTLPMKITRTTYKEFAYNLTSVDEIEARIIAEAKIEEIIEREFKNIKINSKEYGENDYDGGDYYCLQCKIECIEDIAEESAFTTNIETERD